MRKLYLLLSLVIITSHALVSLHAGEFGLGGHDHHGQECQIDNCFFKPISDAASAPSIQLQNAEYWQEPFVYYHAVLLVSQNTSTPRAPPYSV